jgi:benzoate-CoA ligase
MAALLRASAATPSVAATCADDACFWLYSSGSTGAPKGTVHLHSHLVQTAELYGRGVLGIRESDVVYSAAKLFFAYGLGNALTFPMSVGATTVLLPARPAPADVFALLKKYQPTIFYGVPTLYAALLADPAGRRSPSCACASAPAPARPCPPRSAKSGRRTTAAKSSTA